MFFCFVLLCFLIPKRHGKLLLLLMTLPHTPESSLVSEKWGQASEILPLMWKSSWSTHHLQTACPSLSPISAWVCLVGEIFLLGGGEILQLETLQLLCSWIYLWQSASVRNRFLNALPKRKLPCTIILYGFLIRGKNTRPGLPEESLDVLN